MNTTSNPSLPWYTQFRPHVNDKRVNWEDLDLTFAGGKCKLELEYKYSYLIGGVDGFIALEYQPGQEGQGLVFDPPLGQLVEMAKGTTSLSWSWLLPRVIESLIVARRWSRHHKAMVK